MLKLENRTAVITGAGSGLGKAFALRYAAEGAKLLLPDINEEAAEKTAREINEEGGTAAAMYTDISEEKCTLEVAEKVMSLYGRVDILLNDAGLISGIDPRPWDMWTVDLWDKIFAVNMRGTYLMCRSIAPLMEKQGEGKIINIASDVIRMPGASNLLAYACSKSGIVTLTQTMARVLGPKGICVNAIAPGLTETEATTGSPNEKEIFDRTIEFQCIKRRGHPKDLTGLAVFLASEDADFVTGQYLLVNGGAAFAQ
jgi:NAD(P)-dependent dehydrogenase (short-subunit alcohol dehydrogenase family)